MTCPFEARHTHHVSGERGRRCERVQSKRGFWFIGNEVCPLCRTFVTRLPMTPTSRLVDLSPRRFPVITRRMLQCREAVLAASGPTTQHFPPTVLSLQTKQQFSCRKLQSSIIYFCRGLGGLFSHGVYNPVLTEATELVTDLAHDQAALRPLSPLSTRFTGNEVCLSPEDSHSIGGHRWQRTGEPNRGAEQESRTGESAHGVLNWGVELKCRTGLPN